MKTQRFSKTKLSGCRFNKHLSTSLILFALATFNAQMAKAQGGTHPGFDPDFGLFAPLENKILLGVFIIGAIAAIYLFRSKKQKSK